MTYNEILEEDLKCIANENLDELKNKTVFITGATGLIGYNLVNSLLYLNDKNDFNCKIVALVRNKEKAVELFGDSKYIDYIVSDICNEISYTEDVDYIIHAASQTSSKGFVNDSINTIDVALKGTRNVLEFAKKKNIKSMVYLSTMEVYGRPTTDEKIDEKHSTDLDTMEVRNCYPISKRMCENLCVCFDVNVKVLRLTQTFGPGVRYNDERVFAQFARAAIENKDIILHTKGETKRSYLYTADAVKAIFNVLLKGENSQVYNVANEDTYCSIYDMATLVASKCAENKIKVVCEIEEDLNKFGYAPTLHMNLDTKKIQTLGWKPNVNLEEMFNRLIKTMREEMPNGK